MSNRLSLAKQGERSRLRRLFLEWLAAAFDRDRPITKEWLQAIVDASPEYILAKDEDVAFFSIDNLERLRAVVVQSLERLSIDRQTEIFSEAVAHSQDLTLLCHVLRGVAGDRRKGGAEKNSGMFGSDAESIRELLLAKVRDVAFGGAFWQQAEPAVLLWFWFGADVGDEVRMFVLSEMEINQLFAHCSE